MPDKCAGIFFTPLTRHGTKTQIQSGQYDFTATKQSETSERKVMRQRIIPIFLFVAGSMAIFNYFAPPSLSSFGSSAGVSKGTKNSERVYERYSGNTVANPTWPDSADEMVLIQPQGGMRPFYIDRYEATISRQRAWSVAGLVPTTKLRFQDARDACRAAGKRICTTQEWRIACRDGRTQPVYFSNTRELARDCDWARSSGYDQKDHAIKNNSHPSCATPNYQIHHIIGNVAEMTKGPNNNAVIVGMTYLGTNYYGGAFDTADQALKMACEYTITSNYPAGQHNEGMGFRCCADTP
mgnify:CR=1 FL=1